MVLIVAAPCLGAFYYRVLQYLGKLRRRATRFGVFLIEHEAEVCGKMALG